MFKEVVIRKLSLTHLTALIPIPVLHQILLRLSKLCVQEGLSGRKSKKQQQRLLRNMGAHAVVLELLQIPYEKVSSAFTPAKSFFPLFC